MKNIKQIFKILIITSFIFIISGVLLTIKYMNDHQEQIEEIGYLIDHIGNSNVVSEEMRRTVDLFRSKKGGQRC